MAGGGCLGALFGVGWNGSGASPRSAPGTRPNKPIPEDPQFTDEDEGNAHSGPNGGYTGGAYSDSYYGGGLDDDDDEGHW